MTLITYYYSARDQRGRLSSGTIHAESDGQVADWLLAAGLTPVEIDRSSMAFGIRQRLAQLTDTLSRLQVPLSEEDLLLLTRQLHSLQAARIPIDQALAKLEVTARSAPLKRAMRGLLDDLAKGKTLSQAVAARPRTFPPIYPALLELGEATGDAQAALGKLDEHLRNRRLVRQKLISALTYPTLVLVSIVLAILVFTVQVVPQFAGLFERNEVPLPLATRLLMIAGSHLSGSGPIWASLVVLLPMTWFALGRTHRGAVVRGGLLLKWPLLGALHRRVEQTRFASTLAMAYASGLQLDKALGLCMTVVANPAYRQQLGTMRQLIHEGERFSDAAEHAGLLDPISLEMLRIGEETGRLVETTHDLARYRERELLEAIHRIAAAIGPAMTLGLASLVGVLVLGVVLPIWDLSQVLMP